MILAGGSTSSICITGSTVWVDTCSFSRSSPSMSPSSNSSLLVGLFCRLRCVGRSPGVDFGRGGGTIPSLVTSDGFSRFKNLRGVWVSLVSMEPEWRLRRAGTVAIFLSGSILVRFHCVRSNSRAIQKAMVGERVVEIKKEIQRNG